MSGFLKWVISKLKCEEFTLNQRVNAPEQDCALQKLEGAVSSGH